MEEQQEMFTNEYFYKFIEESKNITHQGKRLRQLITEIGLEKHIGKIDTSKLAQKNFNKQTIAKFVKDYEEGNINKIENNRCIQNLINVLYTKRNKIERKMPYIPRSSLRHKHF